MDNLKLTWNKFFDQRSKTLWERFPGVYRSMVVETDDPLQMRRVRFKCPDLHDWDLDDADCPWAVPSFHMGGKGQGEWSNPCRGDWVWVQFERGHPYGPIWTGFADPTRKKLYCKASVCGKTPVPVDAKGTPTAAPSDYDQDYLPKDGRPMSHGWQDRYGSLELNSAVGFYPKEHELKPPPPDHDAVTGAEFAQARSKPLVNSPDLKYMARVSKYGHGLVLSDQGYWWKKADGYGEFTGDVEADEEFETSRWLYLQKLLNEGSPGSADEDGEPTSFGDKRRVALWNRYGSRFEMRDTGWAQPGPIDSKSRADEFGPASHLSKEQDHDFRWIKWRSKGGFLLQAYDKGFHPQDDKFVKRNLLDEQGHLSEREDLHWKDKDARWFRMLTRYGIKLVLDDRGTDDKLADELELPRANGFLVKGRRTGAAGAVERSGKPVGFNIEFNENDRLNRMLLGSPLGGAVEINDRYEYLALCSGLGKDYSTRWRGLEENEFNLHPIRHDDWKPELSSHHLVLDLENEYIRLKTRAGRGAGPDMRVVEVGVEEGEENQGLECRDGRSVVGPWVELVDCQRRGLWLSKGRQLGVWRGKVGSNLLQWIDDANATVVVFNGNAGGKVQIYSAGNVEVMGSDVRVRSTGNVSLQSDGDLRLQAGQTKFTVSGSALEIRTNANFVQGGDEADKAVRPEIPPVVEPDDRAAVANGPFESCPVGEVEHPI